MWPCAMQLTHMCSALCSVLMHAPHVTLAHRPDLLMLLVCVRYHITQHPEVEERIAAELDAAGGTISTPSDTYAG